MATTQEKLVLQVIRERMKDRGLTMSDLAEQIGTSQSSVSRSLSGETELSLERMYEIARVLGVSAAIIFEEAEQRAPAHEFSEELETYLCSDFRRYLVFVALNIPKSINQLEHETNASVVLIQSLIKRLKVEGLLLTLQGDQFQLNDRGRRSKFRKSRSFYDLKMKLYSLQSEHTIRNLGQPPEYWADRDDRLVVAYLTDVQAKRVASMLEALAIQISEMDRQNLRANISELSMYQVFLTQKKFADL